LLGAGAALVFLEAALPAEDDPMVEAWLRFIEQDVINRPEILHLMTEAEAQEHERPVEGVVVQDDEILSDEVTI
jgi:hypothetical protein